MSDVKQEQDGHGENTGHHDAIKKTDYKLLIDPQLRRGEEKLIRYHGESYNTENHGQGVVILRDPRPRMNRLWSRREKADLPVPRYKVDEWYIGAVPPREVTFSRLNDNITKQFMEKMCFKFGKLERVRVYYHPKTQKHMGLSKVVFSSMKSAGECVKKLHMTSIMGNVIHVQIDAKGEILNKLFQRIARGEMVAETIPDVIRHTQDGISMSNKYKERYHQSAKRENRKSSQDDPRRRRSSDTKEKSHARQHPRQEQPTIKKEGCPQRNESQGEVMENEKTNNHEQLSSVEEEDHLENHNRVDRQLSSDSEDSRRHSTDLESRISSLLHGDMKIQKIETHRQQNDASTRGDKQEFPHQEVVKREELKKNFSLDSLDSTALGSSHSEESLQSAPKGLPFAEDQKSVNVNHRPLSYSNSSSPPHLRADHPPMEKRPVSPPHFENTVEHHPMKIGYPPPHDRGEPRGRYSPRHYERSPPYHYRSHRDKEMGIPPHHERNFYSPKHSPDYGRDRRWKPGHPGRGDFDRDLHHFMYEKDERNRRDFGYRRRDLSPPRRPPSPRGRRLRSPEDWPPREHFSTHHLPHPNHRRPSPPRFPHRRRSLSRDGSPSRFRRSITPERRRPKDFEYHRKTPSPVKGPEIDDHIRQPIRRNSIDAESPKLSLDQRLKEMTGEPPSSGTGRAKRKKKDQAREQDNGSSVDMEISEGESDGDKAARTSPLDPPPSAQQINRSGATCGSFPTQEKWNFDEALWNGFGPRGPMHMDPRMWNPMHPNVFKGFEREPRPVIPFPAGFPQEPWASHYHPGAGPPGISPFDFGPNGSFPLRMPLPGMGQDVAQHLEDERLCRCVLDDVVQDLKAIVSRDLNRKVVETMAFKVYESWWDENSNKKAVARPPLSISQNDQSLPVDKQEPILNQPTVNGKPDVKKRDQSLLNAFDPLNWAKNSFEMDGFRIGLGLRSAVSKMPSFRVKKRPRTPTPPRDETTEDMKNKKARRASGKENKERTRRTSKDKKYSRITTLDSGGEDEENQSEEDESDADSSSEQYSSKRKMGVLRVEEVFSESSESEDESSSESEKSEDEDEEEESSEEESASEDEAPSVDVEPQKENEKPPAITTPSKTSEEFEATSDNIPSESAVSTDNNELDKQIKEQSPTPTKKPRTSVDSNYSDDPNIASSLLSPTALGVSASSITPQQLRHVHPKKRHRLLSHDQYEPFAKVANIAKPKDELALITEKERAVLEALADMQRTPDRRSSQDSDNSSLSLPTPTDLKSPAEKMALDTSEGQPCSSPQEEMEAVEALLSIKTSARKTSDDIPEKSPRKTLPKHEEKLPSPPPPLRQDSAKMAELAEEHNYFAPTYGSARPHPTLDPMVSQILEEHNYCQPIAGHIVSSNLLQKDASSPRSISTLSAESIYNFQDEPLEVISAAERVKLRHVQPKKKVTPKKNRRKEVLDLKFDERSKAEDLIIAYEMWCNGLDLEDMKYLRDVYESYLERSNSSRWVNDSHWVPHPVTAISAPTKQKRSGRTRDRSRNSEAAQEPHRTGCARTEGLYRMEDMVKLRQRREMYGQGDSPTSIKVDKQPCNTAADAGAGNQAALDKSLGSRETRHFMRRIAAEVGSDMGDLFKYNQLMFRKKAVKFKKSSIHGWGLFAQEAIAADEMVIEYVGQVVRTLVAERREVNYTKLGIGSSYLFRIDSEHIIDATKSGNYARFMNHSCNPSCYAKVITVDNAKKIVIYSKGPIKKSQEITYDYKFPLEDDKVMCFCGAENCRRTLN